MSSLAHSKFSEDAGCCNSIQILENPKRPIIPLFLTSNCFFEDFMDSPHQMDDADTFSCKRLSHRPLCPGEAGERSILSARTKAQTCKKIPVKETTSVRITKHFSGRKMINEYVKERKISRGSYGKVVLYRNICNGIPYAVKAVCKSRMRRLRLTRSETAMNNVLREVAILKTVDHPNVINLVELIDDQNSDYIYMAWWWEIKMKLQNIASMLAGKLQQKHGFCFGVCSREKGLAGEKFQQGRGTHLRSQEDLPALIPFVGFLGSLVVGNQDEIAEHCFNACWKITAETWFLLWCLQQRKRTCWREIPARERHTFEHHQVQQYHVVIEYVEGSLTSKISETRGSIDETTARRYFRDLVAGLTYLHSHNIVHCDIKPENLLLTRSGRVKIGDFSDSHAFEDDNDELCKCPGTPAFTAPECCSGLVYHGKGADTWAAGVTLYYMVVGCCPFLGDSLPETYDKIINNPLSLPEELNPELKDLLHGLLCKDPSQRISLNSVSEHPWVVKDGGPVPVKGLCSCR